MRHYDLSRTLLPDSLKLLPCIACCYCYHWLVPDFEIFIQQALLTNGALYGVVTESNSQGNTFSSWVLEVDTETGDLTQIASTGIFYGEYSNLFSLL